MTHKEAAQILSTMKDINYLIPGTLENQAKKLAIETLTQVSDNELVLITNVMIAILNVRDMIKEYHDKKLEEEGIESYLTYEGVMQLLADLAEGISRWKYE